MAIKINITAKISNLKNLKSQIEAQLKNVNVGVTGTGTGKTASGSKSELSVQTKQVRNLIDSYKSHEIKRKEFIEGSKSMIQALGKENSTLALRARLTQSRISAMSKETAEVKRKSKAYNDSVAAEKKVAQSMTRLTNVKTFDKQVDGIRELLKYFNRGTLSTKELADKTNILTQTMKNNEKAIKATGTSVSGLSSVRTNLATQVKQAIAAYERETQATKATSQNQSTLSQTVDSLIRKYKLGIITLDNLVASSKKIIASNKENEGELKNLVRLQAAVTSAQTSAINTELKLIQNEEKQTSAIKAKNDALIQEQHIRAELNRIKKDRTDTTQTKEISSMKTYNSVAKLAVDEFKAGKISAKEYMNIYKDLISQQSKFSQMNNKVASQLQAGASKATNTIKTQNRAIEDAIPIFGRQHGAIKYVNKGLKDYLSNLVMITKKFAEWLAVGSIVFLPVRMMQDAIKTIIEMDDALTNLNKVVELSGSQLDDMRASAIELGKSMGISATEILRGMAEFGRVAKVTDDIKELTRVATLASNVTTLTADAAAKAIVSTMITFKQEVKDASHIIDSFNEVQNNFRVSAEDLADSIGKVGAAARQAGISMEELEGYTAAIVSSTGITGSVAGTALKSIISRTYRIGTEGETSAGEVEKTLAGIGIAVRDTSKEFRSFDSIMADLAKKWDTLSNVTKQNIAQTMAGTYHYSRLISLLDNYNIAQSARTKAINSENSALDENAKYLNSITGKLGTLRATLEEKFAESIDVDMIKKAVDVVTDLIDAWASLKNIILVAASVVGIWKGTAITAALSSLGKSVYIAAVRFKAFAIEVGFANNQLRLGSLVTGAYSGALKGLYSLIEKNAFGILITAITVYVLWMDKAKQAEEEANRRREKRNEEMLREQELLNKTIKYYKENYNTVLNDMKVKQELVSLQEQLNEAFGIEANSIDIVNGKYKEQIEYLQTLKKDKLSSTLAEMEKEDALRQNEFYEPILRKGITGKFSVSSSATGSLDDIIDRKIRSDVYNAEEYSKILKETIALIRDSGNEIISIDLQTLQTDKQKYDAIVVFNNELERLADNQNEHNLYLKTAKSFIYDNATAMITFTEKSKEAIELLKQDIDVPLEEYQDAVDSLVAKFEGGAFNTIETEFNRINSAFSSGLIVWDEYSEKADELKEFMKGLGFTKEQVDTLFKFQTGLQRVDISSEDLISTSETMTEAFDKSKETVTLLNTALKELEDKERLSADTKLQLISKYPQLANKMKDIKGLLVELGKLYGQESSSARDAYKESLVASEEFYDALKEGNKDLFANLSEGYRKDLFEYATLQQVKADLMNKIFLLQTSDTIKEFQDNLINAGITPTWELLIEFKNKDQILDEAKQTTYDITQILNDVGNAVDFEDVVDEVRDLDNAFDDLLSNLKLIGGAIETLSDKQSLSGETILELIEKYPKLAGTFKDNATLLQRLKELHGEEAKALKAAYIDKLTTNEHFMETMILSNVSFWNDLKGAYNTDLENWSTYLMLKEEMSLEAIKVIGKQWNVDLQKSLDEMDKRLGAVPEFAKESGSVKQMVVVRDFVAGELMLRDKMKAILGDVDFSTVGFSDSYLNPDKDNKEKANLSKVLAERYTELYLAIDSVNNALEKNNTLQSITESDERKIQLLQEETGLLDKKSKAISNLLLELEKEQKQNIKDLQVKYGVKFTAAGTLESSNISKVLKAQESKVNALAKAANEDAYNIEKERFDKLKELKDRAVELESSELPSLKNEKLGLDIRKKEIVSTYEDIEFTNFEKMSKSLEKAVEPFDKVLKDLNDQLSLTDTDDFSTRIKLMGDITNATTKKQQFLLTSVNSLEKTNYKYGKSQESLIDLTSDYKEKLDDATLAIKENTKATKDLLEEQDKTIKADVKAALEEYIDFINSKIEEEIKIYEELADIESEAADATLKLNAAKISDLEKELQLLKDIRDEKRTSQEKDKFESEINKQENLVSNLEKERNRRVYVEGEGFVWKTDTIKIKEEQDNLKELRQDFSNWEEDQAIEKKEKEIQDLEDKNELIVEAYEKEIKLLEDMLIDAADIVAKDSGLINSWNALLGELGKYSDTYYSESLTKLVTHLTDINKTIKEFDIDTSYLDEILTKIDVVNKESLYEPNMNEETRKKYLADMKKNSRDWLTSDDPKEREFLAAVNEAHGARLGLTKVDGEWYNKDETKAFETDIVKETNNALLTKMKNNSQDWLLTNDLEKRKSLAAKNEALGATLGLTKVAGVWYNKDGTKAFKNGGLVDYTGLAWLDGSKSNPERVLSPDQNKVFNQLASAIPNIAQTTQNTSKNEIYNVSIDKVVTDNALEFVNNLKKITYSRGRGA